MHLTFRNVNDAFYSLVKGFAERTLPITESPSRNGPVLKCQEPMIITFTDPRERVLRNAERNCNPFFHLYEALWMLSGRNDVAPLEYYVKNMKSFSDDGYTLNGAYGYRWRKSRVDSVNSCGDACYTRKDQLDILVEHLRNKPESRRAVLQMWTVEDDLMKIDSSKDVCCNTAAYFSLRDSLVPHNWSSEKLSRKIDQEYEMAGLARQDGDAADASRRYELIGLYKQGYQKKELVLDMTVTNRSNDLVWGMLGANVVHFSFLQEYLASMLGVGVGHYHQMTNDLHIYVNNNSGFHPEEWLQDTSWVTEYPAVCEHTIGGASPETTDTEVQQFVNDNWNSSAAEEILSDAMRLWEDPFLEFVARPMCLAHHAYKRGEWTNAFRLVDQVQAVDWRTDARAWLERRKEAKSA